MRFSKVHQGHSKVVRLQRSFQSESRVLDGAFGITSHWGRTPLRLQCDLTLPPTGQARSNGYQGRTAGRCDHPNTAWFQSEWNLRESHPTSMSSLARHRAALWPRRKPVRAPI